MKAQGRTFRSIGENDRPAQGFYKVALVFGMDADGVLDYHWYVQNADGYWSHKIGGLEVSNRDVSDNLIINPATANRNYGGNGYNYNSMVFFYEVSR